MITNLSVNSHMKKTFFYFLLLIMLSSCKSGKHLPDISGVQVNIATQRFEKDFFSLDTVKIDPALDAINKKYPGFAIDFLFNILGTSPKNASGDIKLFIRSYQSIYKDADSIFADMDKINEAILKSFKYVHYYFPEYKLPRKLISFIGPINGYACILTPDAIAVGLQLFLGKDHPVYASAEGQALYPLFVSRRFDKLYIPVNIIHNIIDDMYPEKKSGRPLIEQMIESGKKLYLIDQFLPELPDSLKTGYTDNQLKDCYKNEKNIWSLFVQNDYLYKADPQLVRDYLTDAPFTQALGEGSPGNIGQFTGWQIVKKWMNKNSKVSLKELMEKDPGELFNEAKYKPQ